jgi:hypothetical protein
MVALLLSLLLLLLPGHVQAIYDPLSVANNKYGIHIADFNDLTDIAPLINSEGGDWGYVTLVATDNDRNKERWQAMFDQMRRFHMVPIVRLATHPESTGWKKPDAAHFTEIVRFLNDLNWPTQNRYIVLYNEPNHANEWGGTIDPEGYALIALELAKTFKEASSDFFILPAGLDVSAASDGASLDAAEYLRRMIHSQPELLNQIDGWTSHSYPNPAFSGSPYSSGRGTIRSFDWELDYLKSLGLTRNLPVFITETGWVHNQGKVPKNGPLSPENVGANLKIAASSVWTDSRIVAVTPFVFNYQDVPFDTFSWKRLGGGGYYAQFEDYRSIPKVKGAPKQREEYILSDTLLPPTLVSGSSYAFVSSVTNRGQGILNANDGYEVAFDDGKKGFVLVSDALPTIAPGESGNLTIHLKTPATTGLFRLSLSLKHGDTVIPLQSRDVQLVPPPSVRVEGALGWRRTSDASDATVLVYDGGLLLHKFTGLQMSEGVVHASGLSDIVPGKKYRVVLLVPSYLPRQTILTLGPKETTVMMKRLYPFDINKDGRFTLGDIWTLLTKPPHNMISLFVSP